MSSHLNIFSTALTSLVSDAIQKKMTDLINNELFVPVIIPITAAIIGAVISGIFTIIASYIATRPIQNKQGQQPQRVSRRKAKESQPSFLLAEGVVRGLILFMVSVLLLNLLFTWIFNEQYQPSNAHLPSANDFASETGFSIIEENLWRTIHFYQGFALSCITFFHVNIKQRIIYQWVHAHTVRYIHRLGRLRDQAYRISEKTCKCNPCQFVF